MKKILLSGMALTLLALACGEEGGITPPPDGLEATTPANCLKIVEVSFIQQNAILLGGTLSDGFVFYFDPDDVGQTPPGGPSYIIPASWTHDEFVNGAHHMLESAHSISFRIPTFSVGTPDPNETTYRVENLNIRLLVMVDEINGFLADAGYCDFEFERYDGKEGGRFWRLTKWWDNTAAYYDAYPGVTPTSLGRILAFYYR